MRRRIVIAVAIVAVGAGAAGVIAGSTSRS